MQHLRLLTEAPNFSVIINLRKHALNTRKALLSIQLIHFSLFFFSFLLYCLKIFKFFFMLFLSISNFFCFLSIHSAVFLLYPYLNIQLLWPLICRSTIHHSDPPLFGFTRYLAAESAGKGKILFTV